LCRNLKRQRRMRLVAKSIQSQGNSWTGGSHPKTTPQQKQKKTPAKKTTGGGYLPRIHPDIARTTKERDSQVVEINRGAGRTRTGNETVLLKGKTGSPKEEEQVAAARKSREIWGGGTRTQL